MPDTRIREAFVRSIQNSVGHCKRSLLDFLDYTQVIHARRTQESEDTNRLFEMLRRRIHNDVSLIRDQMLAAFQVYENDGEAERAEFEARKKEAEKRVRDFIDKTLTDPFGDVNYTQNKGE